MGAFKNVQIEAVEEFHKWADKNMGIENAVEELNIDIWIEAYMMGYANGVKSQYLPKEEAK